MNAQGGVLAPGQAAVGEQEQGSQVVQLARITAAQIGFVFQHRRSGRRRTLISVAVVAPKHPERSRIVGDFVSCDMDGLAVSARNLYRDWELLMPSEGWIKDERYAHLKVVTWLPFESMGVGYLMTRDDFEARLQRCVEAPKPTDD